MWLQKTHLRPVQKKTPRLARSGVARGKHCYKLNIAIGSVLPLITRITIVKGTHTSQCGSHIPLVSR